MRIHRDWWTWIADRFRRFPEKVGGNYHAEHIPQTEKLLPCLSVGCEVRLSRDRVAEITGMTPGVVTKWFRYLTRLGILEYRNAGKAGVGITLLADLTQSPYASRQGEVPEEVEIAAFVPEVADDPETVYLDYERQLDALAASATLAARGADLLHAVRGLEGDNAAPVLVYDPARDVPGSPFEVLVAVHEPVRIWASYSSRNLSIEDLSGNTTESASTQIVRPVICSQSS